MKSFYNKVKSLFLCAVIIVAAPVYSMGYVSGDEEGVAEVGIVEVEAPELPKVWYKKRSIQMGAALTTVGAVYALLVRMNKVEAPFVLAGALLASFASTQTKSLDLNNNDSDNSNNTIIQNNINQDIVSQDNQNEDDKLQPTEKDALEINTPTQNVLEVVVDLFNKITHKATNLSDQDFKDMDLMNR